MLVEVVLKGGLLEAKDTTSSRIFPICARRGLVSTYWSRASRRRLAKTIVQLMTYLQSCRVCYGVTITYQYRDPRTSKRDLDCLRKRLNRTYNSPLVIWKMEFQARGVVHYHLIVASREPIVGLRTWISQTWAQITGDPQLAITGTRVDSFPTQDVKRLLLYVLGHATTYRKDYQHSAPQHAGRWWGVWNKPELPETRIPISYKQFHSLKRALCKLNPKIRKSNRYSYWSYCTPNLFDKLVKWLETLET